MFDSFIMYHYTILKQQYQLNRYGAKAVLVLKLTNMAFLLLA